jgi:hypothetical protein
MTWIKKMRETDGKNMKQKQTTLTGGKSVNPHPLGRRAAGTFNSWLSPWVR